MQLPVYARLFYFTKSLDVKRLELMKLFKNSIYKRSIRQESKMYKNASARSSLSKKIFIYYILYVYLVLYLHPDQLFSFNFESNW